MESGCISGGRGMHVPVHKVALEQIYDVAGGPRTDLRCCGKTVGRNLIFPSQRSRSDGPLRSAYFELDGIGKVRTTLGLIGLGWI